MVFLDSLISIMYASTYVIIVMGLVGNTLLYILYARPNLSKLSFSIYFRSISLTDMFLNVYLLSFYWFIRYKVSLTARSTLACKGLNLLVFAFQAISKWTQGICTIIWFCGAINLLHNILTMQMERLRYYVKLRVLIPKNWKKKPFF